MISVILISLRQLLGWLVSAFGSREDLILENLAMRQQLLALHARRPRRRLTALHKLFWVVLRRLWDGWKEPLILVTPRTVVGWHQAGFRLYWKWLSRTRQRGGRKHVSREIRALIFRMVAENPTWGAPRIHGELLSFGGYMELPMGFQLCLTSHFYSPLPSNTDLPVSGAAGGIFQTDVTGDGTGDGSFGSNGGLGDLLPGTLLPDRRSSTTACSL